MNKHKAWNNNSVVAPKSVGSMTTKGQMKPTFSVPGRREQPKQYPRTYHCIQYSNRPNLQKKSRKTSSMSEPMVEPAKRPNASNAFQIQNRFKNIINSNSNFQSLNSLD